MSRFVHSIFSNRSTSEKDQLDRAPSHGESRTDEERGVGQEDDCSRDPNDEKDTEKANGSVNRSSSRTGESEVQGEIGNATPGITEAAPPADEDEDPNLVRWDSPSDPANPQNWPSWWRWILITLASFISFIAGLSSSMFAPAIPALLEEFHSTNEALGSFIITIFLLGMAAGPLIFAPLSELYGRLVIQHLGNVGFLLFTIAIALATNINMLIVFRLFQGAFSSVCLTNGGGVIADTIPQQRRGFALGMFTVGILAGPVVGPVPGSFLAAARGWRWVFWLISILVRVAIVDDSLYLKSFEFLHFFTQPLSS
jgi:multidrug resistance protein